MKKTEFLPLNVETKYGLTVKALGYEKTRNAILKHVDDDDKSLLEDLRRGPQIGAHFKNEQGGSIFINESSLYSLIFGCRLESAKNFKRWVTKDVLPSHSKDR